MRFRDINERERVENLPIHQDSDEPRLSVEDTDAILEIANSMVWGEG